MDKLMSPSLAVFILMNNYFHDVATAMLVASSLTMWAIQKKYGHVDSPDKITFLNHTYNVISRIVSISWAWIILGGIPRIATFRSFEWKNAVEKHTESGLIVKYIIALIMITSGAFLWSVLAAKIKKLTK